MFCNQCATPLQPDFKVCPSCGRPVSVAVQSAAAANRLQRHLRTLGIMWAILGGLFLIPSVVMMTFGSLIDVVVPYRLGVVRDLGPIAMFLAGGSLLIIGAGGVLVGWGLMQRQCWARTAAIVLGVLALFHPPLGTALGIYTLWVLLANDAATEYRRISAV